MSNVEGTLKNIMIRNEIDKKCEPFRNFQIPRTSIQMFERRASAPVVVGGQFNKSTKAPDRTFNGLDVFDTTCRRSIT